MIEGAVGLIGNGKTHFVVRRARERAKRRGAILAANIRITPPEGVEFVQLTVGFDGLDLDQLSALITRCQGELVEQTIRPGLMGRLRGRRTRTELQPRGLVIVVDEVGILMPARFWQSFPIDLVYTLSQSRKLKADFFWTAQDVEQVDAMLRRLTQWVHKVRAIPAPSIEMRENGRRPWVFRVTTWRPATVDKKEKRIAAEWLRYDRAVEVAYDTDELIRPAERLRKRGRPTKGERSDAVESFVGT